MGAKFDLKRAGSRLSNMFNVKFAEKAEVFGTLTHVDFDEDVSDAGFGTPGDDIDGFIIGTGFRLSF